MKDERYDFLEYIKTLSEDDAKYVRQFYKEWYFDGISSTPQDERLIKDSEMTKEARRNHNSMKTDAFFKAKRVGKLTQLTSNEEAFMEDASDEWAWQDEYKIHGFEAALRMINGIAIRDLDNKEVDKEVTLLRYYEMRDRLRRFINREKKNV